MTTLVWIGAQARAHMKAKILYVEPESESDKSEKAKNPGAQIVKGRGRDKGGEFRTLLSSGSNCGTAGACM